ncbi:hypothetical protein HDU86_002955 [Geranomyces michiganensis]|nr:hypothetical protein HDU86_002955 [Geranomyces michiganensis]
MDYFLNKPTGPPSEYVAPNWPSLRTWLIGPASDEDLSNVLWFQGDILSYTLIWTLIAFSVMYGLAGCWAYVVFYRSRLGLVLLFTFIGIGLFAGATSGAMIGVLLSGIYNAGYFAMATWLPLAWALVQVLILVISSDADLSLNNL